MIRKGSEPELSYHLPNVDVGVIETTGGYGGCWAEIGAFLNSDGNFLE